MILDTNVLLRLLDGPEHPLYKRAAAIVARATSDGGRALVLDATIIELAFVLRSHNAGYGLTAQQIADTILQLADAAELELEHPEAIRQAAADHAATGFDFHDCYLAARAHRDRQQIGSLDRDLDKLRSKAVPAPPAQGPADAPPPPATGIQPTQTTDITHEPR